MMTLIIFLSLIIVVTFGPYAVGVVIFWFISKKTAPVGYGDKYFLGLILILTLYLVWVLLYFGWQIAENIVNGG